MRQGITTKYLGPTNSRGSRIKAIARKADPRNNWPEMSLTVPFDYGLGTTERHAKAAQALAVKLNWPGLWFGGGSLDESGYVFVNVGTPEAIAQLLDAHRANNSVAGTEGADWFSVPRQEREAA